MAWKSKRVWLPLLLAASLIPVSGAAVAQMGPAPMRRAFGERFGRWWDNPRLAQQLAITDQQRQKMDDIFQQHRLHLIDLQANLEKQEVILQPLIESDQPDEGKILAQIDSVAQARAELEKANARMLLGIRRVLTQDQWEKLKLIHQQHRWEHERGEEGREMGRRHMDPGGPEMPAPPPGQSGPSEMR
jgi:periplasmic protein CpxP/Spy